MAAKKEETRELAVTHTELQNYEVGKIDLAELSELIQANFEGDQLTPFDLTQIHVGRGGSTTWEIVGTEEGMKEFECVILYFKNARSFWRTAFGAGDGSSPPDCSSADGMYGNGEFGKGSEGNPSGMCATCPMSKFGTANRNGVKGKGQACAQNRTLFVQLPDTIMPVVVKIPPTSLKPASRYFTITMMDKRTLYWHCTTKLSLRQEKKGGFTVAVANLQFGERLSPEAAARIDSVRAGWMPFFKSVKVDVDREAGE